MSELDQIGHGVLINPAAVDLYIASQKIANLQAENAELLARAEAAETERDDFARQMVQMAIDSVAIEMELSTLRAALIDAAEEVEGWGSYADKYYQDKHDLAGCVANIRKIAAGIGGGE